MELSVRFEQLAVSEYAKIHIEFVKDNVCTPRLLTVHIGPGPYDVNWSEMYVLHGKRACDCDSKVFGGVLCMHPLPREYYRLTRYIGYGVPIYRYVYEYSHT